MNKLFFLLIFIFSLQFTHAQETDKNKQKSEMQQAVDDIKKEISNLEAEIKIAEKNDPAEAAALKNQLAIMQNMLSMLDKTSMPLTQQPKTSAAKASIPKTTASPIVPISLKQPVTVPTAAQAKDKLLWYRGKKYNDSTLVTVKGMVVQFSKKKNEVVLQPQKKSDPFDKMVQELLKSEQRKEELADKFDKMKNGFMYYPELKNGLALIDDLTERFNSVVKNTIKLPVMPMSGSQAGMVSPNVNGHGPFFDIEADEMYDTLPGQNKNEAFFEEINKKMEQQLALAKKLYKELPDVSDFPPPPVHEFGMCNFCDTSLLRKQKVKDSIWMEKYFGKEQEIAQLVLGVERQKQLLGLSGGSLAQTGDGDINLLHLILERGKVKSKILYEKYSKDVRYLNVVAQVMLGHERQLQLMGYSDGADFTTSELLTKSFDAYDKYLDEQIEVKNHDFVLNFASHIGNMRQKALLGVGNSDGTDFEALVNKLLRYNRFLLSVDLEFIFEERDDEKELEFKATGALATKGKVYAMFISDSCSYRMIQYNADMNNAKLEDVTVPLTVKYGEKTIKDEDGKYSKFSYSGPEGFPLQFPDFKIDFCSNKPDSAFFVSLVGDQDAASMHARNLGKINQSYKVDFLLFANFIFVNPDLGNKDREFEDVGNDMLKSIAGFQNMQANSKLEKLKMQYEGKRQMDSYRKGIQNIMDDKKAVLLFSANNRSTVLVDKYEDTKRKLEDNIDLTRGLIHLRIVHDPVR